MDSRKYDYEKIKRAAAKYALPCLMVLFVGLLIGFEMRSGSMIEGFEINSKYEESTSESDVLLAADKTTSGKTSSSKSSSGGSSSSKSASSKSKSTTSSTSSSQNQNDAVADDSKDSHLPYNTVGNTVSNTLNGGFAAQQGNWIYYRESDDGDRLYRMNTNGGDLTRISDSSVSYISVAGENIIMRDTSTSIGILCYNTLTLNLKSQIHFNPYYLTLLLDGSFVCADYTYGSAIYLYDLNSNSQTFLYNDYVTKMSSVYENDVYFIDQSKSNYLYSMNLDSKEIELQTNCEVTFYGINDGDLYYVSGNYLYNQQNPNAPISKYRVGCINVTDHTIYFSNLDDGEKLYSMDLEGGNVIKLTDCPIDGVCVAGRWIFYEYDEKVYVI